MPGALAGLKVLELGGIGPTPHAATILADHGADVIRIERGDPTSRLSGPETGGLLRGIRIAHADLKTDEGHRLAKELACRADCLIEGFRPGVMERLGLAPEDVMAENPRLIYTRVTGWGQHGPSAQLPGHDINYLALSGLLDNLGPEAQPLPPLNLVADFGGGSMFALVGILLALHDRERRGHGQVVEASMLEGIGSLGQMMWGQHARGDWKTGRSRNLTDGSAPFYATYQCSDGRFIAVGALEAKFFETLLNGLGLTPGEVPAQWDRARWPGLRRTLEERFAQATRDQWATKFEGSEACVTPVLTLDEAPHHPQAHTQASFATSARGVEPRPSPRLSGYQPRMPGPPQRTTLAAELTRWSSEEG